MAAGYSSARSSPACCTPRPARPPPVPRRRRLDRDLVQRADQAVPRRTAGRRSYRPIGARRLGVRLPRPERIRQDDHDPDAARPGLPTSGRAELLGVPMPDGASRVLHRVGSLVEGPACYPFLSGRDNLARYDAADRTADPRTMPDRITEALDRVGLLSAARKRYRNYSLGMKQRLAIAASLLRPRELIILDEPTNGLDPQGTREVRALVRQIAADGTTVFISSHLLAEVEQICTHVGVMRTGRLVFQGPLRELRDQG